MHILFYVRQMLVVKRVKRMKETSQKKDIIYRLKLLRYVR
jgi:hypothetical protein